MSNAERFAALFAGYTARYGRYDITGQSDPEEKVAGRATTVDVPVTFKNYREHVEGKVGIGVIPLREDNRVNFAALDIDVYKDEEKKKRNLTHQDVAIAFKDTPLIVSSSKSGGIHVWLFSAESVSSKLAVDYLEAKAAEIGVAGCEVFPKQTERYNEQDIGNWINLPYFGDTRKAVIPYMPEGSTVYEFLQPDLEQFLDIASQSADVVTDEWLESNTKVGPQQTEKGDLWFDGPPCLQALLVGFPHRVDPIERAFKRGDITEDQYKKKLAYTKPQLGEGNRNNAFFNVGLYLRRRMFDMGPDQEPNENDKKELAEALDDVHSDWRALTGDKGIKAELPTIARQAFKGKWGYKCSAEPLKSHCNRRQCLKRKFGVGSGTNDSMGIKGFTIVTSDPPQYYMTINERRVYIADPETLSSQNAFGVAVMAQTHKPWSMMTAERYRELLDGLFSNPDMINPPPESDRRHILLVCLRDYIDTTGKMRGKNDAAIFAGNALISEDESEAWFVLRHFQAFVRKRGYSWDDRTITRIIVDEFDVLAHKPTTIAGKSVRPYVANMARLDQIEEELSREEA